MGDKRPFRTTRSLASLRSGRDDWYKLQAAPKVRGDAGGSTQLLIYDEISWWGIAAEQLVSELQQVTGALEVHINSPGGDVFDGIAIMNALKAHQGPVTIMVDGLAASAASVIAMAADPGQLVMCPGSMLMIHDAWGMSIGNAADMTEMAALLDKASGNIADVYAARAGKDNAHWRGQMTAETWFTAQEAVDAGLADRVRQADDPAAAVPATANTWDLSIFARAPKAAKAAAEQSCEDLGHQCCQDAAAAAASARLGAESMPVIEGKALAIHHTATVDDTWDGPAAVAAMPAEAAVLEFCHAWQESGGDPDVKGTYKFPHHKTKGGPANLSACRNGLARLSGADIPDGDRAGVKAHLQAHLDDGSKSEADNRAGMPAWLRENAEEA